MSGQDLETVVSWISGEPGTDVELRILRDGEELDVTVTRDVIETKTVEYEMKEDGIGYIRVEEFDKVTYDQFKAALDDLEGQGMNSLIIDLRGNPGGQLTTVTDMLKLFLPEGVIVSTKDKYGNTDEITCDGDHEFKNRWRSSWTDAARAPLRYSARPYRITALEPSSGPRLTEKAWYSRR